VSARLEPILVGSLALSSLIREGKTQAEVALEKALDKEGFAKAVGLEAALAP